ncbi:MAG TPA: FAD-binding oxidoreductase [Anaerolineae bacterium]|nr:FAD-binding oxidoreductase [Anaerolineae bacterium]HMR64753.1 FAD-binding oxidoreductase [Anaerolineae bacterium]
MLTQELTVVKEKTRPDKEAVENFKSKLRGGVYLPGESGYEQARSIWNGMIERRPEWVARCTGVADVIAAVNFARDNDLLLSVRGGGHNVAGSAVGEGGLMIDLSLMRGIHVDPKKRIARVQPGINWGDLDRETQLFGLAAPGGIVSATGVAGLTLGGGFGWLSRKHGLTSDSLLSADVVLADGRFVKASPTENADLFWGLRGGGGNFGIVTSFEFQLQPLGPEVMAGLILYPFEDAREVLEFYRDFSASAPAELGTMAVLRIAPPAPFLPKHVHGQPVVGIGVCYAGSVEDGIAVVRSLKEFGSPLVDLVAPKPYVAHQTMLDAASPSGRRYYWKSEYLAELSDGARKTLLDYSARLSSPMTAVLVFQLGGAISQVAEPETAAGNREAAYVLNIQSAWEEPAQTDKHIEWTRTFWRAMQPFASGGVYVNFLSEGEGEARIRAAYPGSYERLVDLKNRYDPTNLFRLNQNIKPTV